MFSGFSHHETVLLVEVLCY